MNNTFKQEDFEKVFKQHLKVETYSKTIESLLGPRLLDKIDFKPYYQRNYVWDNAKASYFIESILLGTEIPPLIFFNNNNAIEVIDGRQRFETITRFKDGKFSLSQKGLNGLKQLSKLNYEELSKREIKIIESFLDAKIRIIEFALVNEPPLNKSLEDKVKKEIFSRYNTGITPLKKSEIDNAVYDSDPISTLFKQKLKENKEVQNIIQENFFKITESKDVPVDKIMEFVRRHLVLQKFPINIFARGGSRVEIIEKLYEYLSNNIDDENVVFESFIEKVKFVNDIRRKSVDENLKTNRFALECILWALSVLDSEGLIDKAFNNHDLKNELCKYINDNFDSYNYSDYHYYKAVTERFSKTASFFENYLDIKLGIYLTGSPEKRNHINEVREPNDTISKLSQLESLRLNKPEPARNSIEDITRLMQRRRFMVRPTYQRQEVINTPKASSIIESILLGITLPAIFIYKREDGISEVIDGQQRILTILGFLGEEYIDENGNSTKSKNHKFKLRNLRILKEINGLQFSDLSKDQRDKILDFQLYVVEIEQTKNPNFNPIDLFIRLNDKPYPIKEHSFEMWNSWVDPDIIKAIKDLVKKYNEWFYLKAKRNRDRMENEELFMLLVFLDFYSTNPDDKKVYDVYQKGDKINARVSDKAHISNLLLTSSDPKINKGLHDSIKNLKSLIQKVKYILLDQDKSKEELSSYLKNELDAILKGNKHSRNFRRTLQDIYIIQELLCDINTEMVKSHRIEMKKEISNIFSYIKNIPDQDYIDNRGFKKYKELKLAFLAKYKKEERKLKLSTEEKMQLLRKQNNVSTISGAPVFLGDDIEVDHIKPLATGGKDNLANLGIVHSKENRVKGVKNLDTNLDT